MERIYLDHAATSPMHPAIVEKIIPYMTEVFGNPSSIHHFGRQSRHALDEARQVAATSINAKSSEIIFTSGGTEADNLAILGAAYANRSKGNHIITTSIEHHAVLHTCEYLERRGFSVTYLPVDESGMISLGEFIAALTDQTILVTIMFGNNEVGMIQPLQEIGDVLKNHQAIFHTDAVQVYGLTKINVKELNVDLLSISSHKINGPKGTGFLFVRDGVKLVPHFFGGEQERKRRAGTENVAGIVGLRYAIEEMNLTVDQRSTQYRAFKEVFLKILEENNVKYHVNGNQSKILPHILNIYFPGTSVESMLVNLDLAGIAASSGSACTAGSIDPSHVLVAMYGNESERITSSIRFSFGLGNTEEHVRRAAQETANIINRLTK